MSTVSDLPAPTWTMTRLRRHFGGIPAERIHLDPPPGLAKEKHLIDWNERRRGITCELVDGVLVEKAVGYRESLVATFLITALNTFVQRHRLGIVLGEAGTLRLWPGLVRAPDVCFLSWESLGTDELPDVPFPTFSPDLAIEVVSISNTKKEMTRKTEEYFALGSKQVWIVWPKKKSVDVFTAVEAKKTLGKEDVFNGGTILPGFRLRVADLFETPKRPRSK